MTLPFGTQTDPVGMPDDERRFPSGTRSSVGVVGSAEVGRDEGIERVELRNYARSAFAATSAAFRVIAAALPIHETVEQSKRHSSAREPAVVFDFCPFLADEDESGKGDEDDDREKDFVTWRH